MDRCMAMKTKKNKKVYLNYTCPICHKTHRVYYKREDLPRYLDGDEKMVCRECSERPKYKQLSFLEDV